MSVRLRTQQLLSGRCSEPAELFSLKFRLGDDDQFGFVLVCLDWRSKPVSARIDFYLALDRKLWQRWSGTCLAELELHPVAHRGQRNRMLATSFG
ncbi:hypothetical protein BC358_11220 [Hydrogenophaga sp. H7]|nr:hypothetical protein BC358_11220 [Hydrogenophaga sp. H7]